MKKILYLHPCAYVYGSDLVLLELIKGLDKNKYKPIVVLPTNGPLVNRLKEIGVDVHIIEYPVLCRKICTPKGILNYICTYKKYCKEIIKLIENENIDIVHANTIAVLEGIYIAKKLKKPLVWHIHETLKKPRIVYKVTSYLVGKYSTKIICVSNSVKDNLLKSKCVSKDKIEVIYNGVDQDRFNPSINSNDLRKELNIPSNSFILGMIGRVNAIKGQSEFVKIVENLNKKYDVYGIIVGDAINDQKWREEELRKEIELSACKDKLLYLGYRSDNNILHSLFDVYVLPSVAPDSLPTVVLEAMATKKVAVGYKCGGISEMVVDKKTGYLEDIGNNIQLSSDIENLINNKELYNSMSNLGYDRLTKYFSLSSFNKNIDNLYNKL